MKKRLEVKIIDTARRLNRRVKSEYTLLNLNDKSIVIEFVEQ